MEFHDATSREDFRTAAQRRPSDDETRYLAIASMHGNLDYIQDFFNRYPNDADATTSYGNGWTALMWAARYEQLPVIDHLLDKGAKIEARNRDGFSVLDIASTCSYRNFAREIKNLRDHKTKIKEQQRDEEIIRTFHTGTAQPVKAFKPLSFSKNN